MTDEATHTSQEWIPHGPTVLSTTFAHWRAIVSVAILFAVVGYAYSASRPPVFEATTVLFLSDLEPGGAGALDHIVEQEASRLASRTVLRRTAERIGPESIDALTDRVTVASDPDSGVIEVIATADTAELAANTVNTIAEVHQELKGEAAARRLDEATTVLEAQEEELTDEAAQLERQLEQDETDAAARRRLQSIQEQLSALRIRMSEMAADAALSGTSASDVEPAVPPRRPTSPRPQRDAVLGFVLGFAVATATAFWRSTLASAEHADPSTILGAPMLAEIPDFPTHRRNSDAPEPLVHAGVTDAYQFLVAALEYRLKQMHARSVLVTSVSAGEGKSLTALHVARALAVRGRDVVLVDADVRARGLSSLLNSTGKPGLVSVASGAALSEVICRFKITDAVDLPVVPAGPSPERPTDLISTQAFRTAIATITDAADMAIFDSGPLLAVPDASILAADLSAILLVTDVGTTREDLKRAAEYLSLIPTPLVGFVRNRVPVKGRRQYHRSDGPT